MKISESLLEQRGSTSTKMNKPVNKATKQYNVRLNYCKRP
jgi:hypothetical protein